MPSNRYLHERCTLIAHTTTPDTYTVHTPHVSHRGGVSPHPSPHRNAFIATPTVTVVAIPHALHARSGGKPLKHRNVWAANYCYRTEYTR